MANDSNQSSSRKRLHAIFEEARNRPPGEARERYLQEACGADPALRRRVESLLRADESADPFLESSVTGEALDGLAHEAGMMIGHYRLVEELGQGGFGVVWRAAQLEPVKREVALKIIKLGMDTKEVIARFEAERQALAMMEHPNIARVYDAGATETGRPYFVMDLIVGEPITDYCDQRKLPVAQRIELFVQVCDAVQHAHSRGIVHRDLKPSNVVVVVQNGKPLVKVIDFGIAKSMQGRLTDRTLITRREVLLGTPAYMSPEQLNLDADTVDARSDVYSLGVLLYELIAGAPPFESDTLRKAAFAEVQRILREVDPPKPSTRRTQRRLAKRLATSGKSELRNPKSEIDKDLDCIVMHALEKEPARRYATAADLAHDLQRHLRHEPVSAGPPSVGYRVQKFARRHRGALVSAAAIAFILIVAVAFGLRQQHQAQQAAERAREAEAHARSLNEQSDVAGPDAGALIQGVVNVEEFALLSPDETMLAYVGWDVDATNKDLLVRDLDTGKVRNLTESVKHAPGTVEMCYEPFVWSADSKWVAYNWASFSQLNFEQSLRMVAARGGEITIIKPPVPDETCYYPEDWSQDGRELLCQRWRGNKWAGWVLISVETGEVRELITPESPRSSHVRLSPGGDSLVYELGDSRDEQDTKGNLYLLDIATGQTNRLTYWEGEETKPIWAPQASVVLFSSDRLGSWDLWGVKIEEGRPESQPFLVRYGVGNHDKRLTRAGKLILQRPVAKGDGYTIAGGAPAEPVPQSGLPGIIYFLIRGQLHTMTPDGEDRKMLPPNVRGEPSSALHGGHRWFLHAREVPGQIYPSGDKRKELFVVRGDGDEALTVQLTDDPTREPLTVRWATDRETGTPDGMISWAARLWEKSASAPPVAIFAATVTFDESGNLVTTRLLPFGTSTGQTSSSSPPGPGTLLVVLPPQLPLDPNRPTGDPLPPPCDPSHDWSPGGDKLAYCRAGELVVLDLASGEMKTLAIGRGPSWSPDGTRIAFHHEHHSIRVINLAKGELTTIVDKPQHLSLSPFLDSPTWSPDSSHLVYYWFKPPRFDIYRIPAAGGDRVNLTRDMEPGAPVAWRGETP